jgi:hypothetical protein
MSPSLRQKIARARAQAPHELPMARLCADVILAALDGEAAMQSSIAQLKNGVGQNWSPVTALQFMSGRRGEFAADCAAPEEQANLHLAHLVAKHVCSENGLGAVQSPDGLDMAKLRALVLAARAGMQ